MRDGMSMPEVHKLAKAVSQLRASGAGPDEAWAKAKTVVYGVSPEALERWRPEIEKMVDAGTAAVPVSQPDVFTRAAKLETELIDARRKVAELAEENEKLRKENEELILGDSKGKNKK